MEKRKCPNCGQYGGKKICRKCRTKLDKGDELAPRAPISFWGLCGHCIEEKRVRFRRMLDGRYVRVCDDCFDDGAIIVDMCCPEPDADPNYSATQSKFYTNVVEPQISKELP